MVCQVNWFVVRAFSPVTFSIWLQTSVADPKPAGLSKDQGQLIALPPDVVDRQAVPCVNDGKRCERSRCLTDSNNRRAVVIHFHHTTGAQRLARIKVLVPGAIDNYRVRLSKVFESAH